MAKRRKDSEEFKREAVARFFGLGSGIARWSCRKCMAGVRRQTP